MAPNPTIMQAVEKLDYRVTVGDVASQAGLDIKVAEQGLLALASEAGGHLQVSDTGEIAYLFPRNFRSVLQSKYFRLRLQEWWNKVWKLLFYLIRISFGILLIASIVLIIAAITIILIALNSSRDGEGDRRDDSGGGFIFFPRFWFGPDLFWVFYPDYYDRRSYRRQHFHRDSDGNRMNFLESIFSFLFGDGNPNADLEDRRWRTIATVIRNNRGAVVAEQIAPYLDDLGSGFDREYESFMLPVLSRFNGRPEVSPDGQIVYHFPELQVTATESRATSVSAYLREALWRFSEANAGQISVAIGLGVLNLAGAITLGVLLADGTIAAEIGGLVAFVSGIYWVLLGYGIAFLTVPLVRYFWIKWRNRKVEARNSDRQERAMLLNEGGEDLERKLSYAHQFAAQTVVTASNLAYTTETDLTEQELAQSDQIDAEWRRRLEGY
ncbi:hypothetical protein H6G89_27960 [Oscillatoria sp. FACHB-1407]|uniref:hypothetical protein n=1 Tax=Oscillatoria sp. FACHB-1407 TaxID=2692847 RepID=UPI0016888DD0|nr:hypothetical protein [Oscillatoria sp. FACHB-1407]MBD2464842.1 hypothetical protein [Oscillatoria sp. FACHB-1407]